MRTLHKAEIKSPPHSNFVIEPASGVPPRPVLGSVPLRKISGPVRASSDEQFVEAPASTGVYIFRTLMTVTKLIHGGTLVPILDLALFKSDL